jgi:hypothetical protein
LAATSDTANNFSNTLFLLNFFMPNTPRHGICFNLTVLKVRTPRTDSARTPANLTNQKEWKMNTFKLVRAVAAALTLCTGVAQASPVVTSWSVIDTAKFVTPISPAGNIFPNPVLSGGDTVLSWGNASPQSSLVITNSGVPIVVPDATLTSTVQITHNNFPIPLGNSLTQADILASLSLTSLTPSVGLPLASALTFTIKFIETTNEPGTGVLCADGGTNHVGVNINGCADIFVLSNNALNFPFLYDSDGAVNGLDPQPYFASFFATGLGTLSNAACTAAGALNGCRGFETAENASTTADFQIRISSTPFQVPEPSSMALMGGAFSALAWVSRRRKLLEA